MYDFAFEDGIFFLLGILSSFVVYFLRYVSSFFFIYRIRYGDYLE
jgi:hypothetical protein